MTRPLTCILVASALLLPGCYSSKGGVYPYSGGGYTYLSSEMRPVTVTVVDTRTEQPFFKLDIPPGKQLTMNFLEGQGDDPVERPDRMVYAIWDAGTATGTLDNQLTCPPEGCRRIVYDIRNAPEWREEPPEYADRIDSHRQKPAWWTPQGGELPKTRRFYE